MFRSSKQRRIGFGAVRLMSRRMYPQIDIVVRMTASRLYGDGQPALRTRYRRRIIFRAVARSYRMAHAYTELEREAPPLS